MEKKAMNINVAENYKTPTVKSIEIQVSQSILENSVIGGTDPTTEE